DFLHFPPIDRVEETGVPHNFVDDYAPWNHGNPNDLAIGNALERIYDGLQDNRQFILQCARRIRIGRCTTERHRLGCDQIRHSLLVVMPSKGMLGVVLSGPSVRHRICSSPYARSLESIPSVLAINCNGSSTQECAVRSDSRWPPTSAVWRNSRP